MSIDPRTLQVPSPEQYDAYQRPMSAPPLPGRYLGKIPDSFTYEAHDGYLRVMIHPIELLDVEEGKDNRIGFERCSAKPRTMGRMAGTSRLTDFLLAAGVGKIESSEPDEWVAAIESTAGSTVEFYIDWDAYDSEAGEQLAGRHEDFPDDPEKPGEKLAYIPTQDGRKVPARARIRYYVRPR